MTKYFTYEADQGLFDSRNFPIYINKISRPLMPGKRTNAQAVGRKAGSYLLEASHDSVEITVEITFLSDTDQQLRKDLRELALALHSHKAKKLIFSDEPDVYVMAQLAGDFDFNNFAAMGIGKITFLVGDPFAYKVTETTQLFPTPPTNFTVFVDGYETYPRFRIVPLANTATIRVDNVTTGKFFLLEKADFFLANTAYIVDCVTNLVYKESDWTRMMNTLNIASDFFSLKPGNNVLSITPSTNMSANVYFRDRYL